jgi:predicted nucleic acid-binding protein
MSRIVLLDSGPLGKLSHPRADPEIVQWLVELRQDSTEVRIPEVVDYELRRELLRAGKTRGIQRLDVLGQLLGYVAVTRSVLLQAAGLWAEARRIGQPTAVDAALDIDVILAAHALVLASAGHTVAVATENVGHLSRFADARDWRSI